MTGDFNPPGEFIAGWRPVPLAENSRVKCQRCPSQDLSFREWESSCGGYEDTQYRCEACGHGWWVESADS